MGAQGRSQSLMLTIIICDAQIHGQTRWGFASTIRSVPQPHQLRRWHVLQCNSVELSTARGKRCVACSLQHHWGMQPKHFDALEHSIATGMPGDQTSIARNPTRKLLDELNILL